MSSAESRGGSASGPSIAIAVKNANGELLEVEAEGDCTVYGLKCRVAESWQVPPSCQRLTYEDAELLSNSAHLAELKDDPSVGSGALKIKMAVVSEEVFKCLDDEDCAIRRMAVQTLGQVAHKDFAKAMSALARQLHDPEWEVRKAAIELLGQVAPKGDEGALGAALAHLQDRSVSVKQVSILTLAQLAEAGDARVVDAIIPMLEDRDDGVRQAVGEALANLIARGTAGVVETVSSLLGHWSVLVKRAAIETLGRIGEKGDARLIEKIGAFLGQEPGLIRVAAVLAIGELAKGEKQAVGMVFAALEDPDERVQAAAAFILREAGLGELLESDTKDGKAAQSLDQRGQREGPGGSKALMKRSAST